MSQLTAGFGTCLWCLTAWRIPNVWISGQGLQDVPFPDQLRPVVTPGYSAMIEGRPENPSCLTRGMPLDVIPCCMAFITREKLLDTSVLRLLAGT